MVLIGIGNAGHNLINNFGDQHKKISILSSDFPKKCSTVEEYEKFCPNFTKRLKFAEDECWVALCGAGKVPGCTLRILEKLRNKKINIIYICPELSLCNPVQRKRHKVAFNVLQEFTRSGLLDRMYLFSNKQILNVIGDQPIIKMYEMINKQIANSIETIEWFKTQTPIIGSVHDTRSISRLCSISVGDFENNNEKMLFLLDNVTETSYIYSISKTKLNENKELLTLIKNKVIEDEENKVISSFTIYPSLHKESFFYSLKFSHVIQELEGK